jgi:hypothetical protein
MQSVIVALIFQGMSDSNPAQHHPVGLPHRLVQAKDVHAKIHGGGPLGRFNAWLAVRATAVLGNMWFFWFCVVLDLIELPAVIASQSVIGYVTYISQTVIQLLALPLLQVGQRIISEAQDQRAATDHETLVTLYRLNEQQLHILKGQNEVLKGQDEVLNLLRSAVVPN